MSITKTIRLSGSSPNSLEDAVHVVVARAAMTISDITHWTLVRARGGVDSSGAPTDFEVTLDITFTVKEAVDHG